MTGRIKLTDEQKKIAANARSKYSEQYKQAASSAASRAVNIANKLNSDSYLDHSERVALQKNLYQLNKESSISGNNNVALAYQDALNNRARYDRQFADEGEKREYERLISLDLDTLNKQIDAANNEGVMAKLSVIGSKFAGYGGKNDDYEAIKAAGEYGKDTLSKLPDIVRMEQDYAKAKQYQDSLKYANLLADDSFMSAAKTGASLEGNRLTDAVNNYGTYIQEKIGSGYLHNLTADTPRTAEGFNSLLSPDNKDAYFTHALGTAIGGSATDAQKKVDLAHNMTQKEIDLYNALFANEGEESANAYLDYLEETLNQRAGKEIAEYIDGKTVHELLYSIPAGLDQWYSGTRQTLSGETLPTTSTQYASGQIRENLSDTGAKLPDWMGGSSLGQAAYDIGTTSANMAPSILASALLGGAGAPAVIAQGVGSAVMASGVYGNSYNQAVKEGYTKKQASNYAALTTLAETFMQNLLGGISKLGGVVTKNVVSKAIQNIGSAAGRIAVSLPINMMSEGIEEYLQDVLEPAFRNLAFDENNEVKLFTPEAAYSGILGALTAGFLDGPSTISKTITTTQYGKMVNESGHTDMLIQNALNLEDGTDAVELARKISEGEIKANNANVGELITKYVEEGGNVSFLLTPIEKTVESNQNQMQDVQSEPAHDVKSVEEQKGVPATLNNESRQEVSVAGIDSVQDGTVFVELSNGTIAPLSEMTIDDPALAEVYEQAKLFDTDTARAYVAAYDGSTDAKTLYNGFVTLYGAARKGVPFQQAVEQNSLAVEDLSPEAQMAAYAAGQVSLNQDTSKSTVSLGGIESSGNAEISVATNADGLETITNTDVQNTSTEIIGKAGGDVRGNTASATSKNVTGVVRDYKAKLSRTQRRQVNAVDSFGKAVGRKFVIQDNIYADANMRKVSANLDTAEASGLHGVNAYFDPSDNAYYISLDSVGQALMFYALHENVHDIAKNNPAGYANLQKIVFDVLGEEAVSRAREVQRDLHPNETEAHIDEEVVANTVPAILSDADTYKELARRVAKSSSKTRQAFETLLQRLEQTFKRAYDRLKQEKSWEQLKQLEQDQAAIKRVRDAYLDALEGMQNAGSESKSANPIKFSLVEPFVDADGNRIENAVLLDTDFFDGLSPRNWGQKLRQLVNGRAGKNPVILPITDENGNAVILEFARKNDRVQKDNKSKHIVLNELLETSDNISKLAVVHIDEIVSASEKNTPYYTKENTHGWLDKNGWLHRNANVINQKNGNIYNITIDIAKTSDGRTILYATNGKIKRVGNVKVDSLKIKSNFKGPRQNSDSYIKIAHKKSNVKTSSENSSGNTVHDGKSVSHGRSYEERKTKQAKYIDNPDIRFSLKDVSAADVETLRRENRTLTEALDAAKAQLKLTKGKRQIKPGAFAAYARKILKDIKSSYSVETLTENLSRLWDSMEAAAESPSLEAAVNVIEQQGIAMAKAALEKSRELDTTMSELYDDVRRYLRETPVKLTEIQRQEAAYQMDSYGNYRRALMGNVNLAKNGRSLDSVWQELSAMHPELFPADTNEGDMPGMLYAVVKAMKPVYRNPYGYDLDGAAADLYLEILTTFADMPTVKTFADRKQAEKQTAVAKQKEKTDAAKAEIKAIKADMAQRHDILSGMHEREVKKLRQEMKAKLEEARKQAKKEQQAAVRQANAESSALLKQHHDMLSGMHKSEMRREIAQTIVKERAKFTAWKASDRARRRERADVKKYRDRITANVKTLTKWMIRPTDTQHVPEVLRRTVSDFVQSVNFESDRATKRNARWRESIQAVRDTMARMERGEGEFADFYADIDPNLVSRLEAFIGSTRESQTVAELDMDQLRELDFLTAVVRKTVTDANKMLSNARYEKVADTGNTSIRELNQRKARKPKGKLGEMLDGLLNVDQLDSFSYFDQLGDAAVSVFESLRNGFDKKVVNTRQAVEYMNNVLKDKNIQNWSGKNAQIHTFKVTGGEIQLTTAQIMELYLLNQREQAKGHIYGEGIKPAKQTGKIGRKNTQTVTHAPVKVSEADVAKIVDTLTNEQRAVADAVQRFMEKEVSKWGNEASLELYGYKKFNEEHYYPIESDQNYTLTQDPSANSGLYALRNLGATKATVQGANNAIIINDIFDTFTKHIDEMASYNAFTVPLSDAMKWFNYKNPDGTGSVKQAIERVLGQKGKQYFINFIKDVNGVGTGSYTISLADSLTRNAKVAAVGGNLRVALQQPTAYARASAMISPKYLAKAVFRKSNVEKAKKYSPIAQWKSWGFFDTSIGKSMRQLIIGDQSLAENIREKSLWLAGKADDITWGTLWNACELEISDTHPELKVGGDEFNRAVGKRLSEIVDRTQVVDSVFHRSQIMRSKDGITKIYTAFMSEPTKTYNLLRSAAVDVVRNPQSLKARRKLVRVVASVAVTGVFTSLAAAVSDAFRDDDDEKEWLEKYSEAFENNLKDNLNPLNLIPLAKEIQSIIDGYDASRIDLQGVEKAIRLAGEIVKLQAGDSKWSVWKFIKEGSNAVSSVTGIPVGNVIRELYSVYNAFSEEPLPMVSNLANAKGVYETAYKAYVDGDSEKGKRLLEELYADKVVELTEEEEARKAKGEMAKYKDSASIEAYARNAIERGMADVLVDDPRISKAFELRENGMDTELKDIYRELKAEGFEQDMITRAINAYANELEKEPSKVSANDIKMYNYENLYAAVERGDAADIDAIFGELVKFSTSENAEESITNSVRSEFKKRYLEQIEQGNVYRAGQLADYVLDNFDLVESAHIQKWVEEAYQEVYMASPDSSVEANLRNILVNEYGYQTWRMEELQENAEKLELANTLKKQYPDLDEFITADRAAKYYEYAEPANISVQTAIEFFESTQDIHSIKDDDGNIVETKQEQVWAVIDLLDLTRDQKDAMHCMLYSVNSVSKAPWN